MDFGYSFAGKNGKIIANYVVQHPDINTDAFSSVLYFCDFEILTDGALEQLVSLLKDYNFGEKNEKIVANYVVQHPDINTEVLRTALEFCDSELLTENVLEKAVPLLDSCYSFDGKNGKIIADYVVQHTTLNPSILSDAIDNCSLVVFNANKYKLLTYFESTSVITTPARIIEYVFERYSSLKLFQDEVASLKEYMGYDFDVAFLEQNLSLCYEIFNRLKYTNSKALASMGKKLMTQLLKVDHPFERLGEIETIFVRNNIPLFGKVYFAFQILYPNFGDFNFGDFNFVNYDEFPFEDFIVMSPELKDQSLGKVRNYTGKKMTANDVRFNIIYNDLMRIAVRSNNINLRQYLNNISEGNDLFVKLFREEIFYDDLSAHNKKVLDVFSSHLEVLYLNTVAGKNSNIDFSQYSLLEKIDLLKDKFKPTSRYDLKDRIVRSFGYSAGYKSFDSLITAMDNAVIEADIRGREYAENLSGNNLFTFEDGDFVRGIGDYEALSGSLDGGNISEEYLTVFKGISDSDLTPLDIDFSYITTGGTVSEVMESTITGNNYGDVCLIIKNSNPNLNITRDKNYTLTDTQYDASKIEMFRTCEEGHWGARTGIALTDVDYILYRGSDSSVANSIKFDIARHGYYMPVINDDGKLIFTVEEYENIRKQMSGLSYYGISDYKFSDNLIAPNVSELVSKFDYNEKITTEKRNKIDTVLQEVFSKYDLTLSHEITEDLTPGTVELIDTGSTGRGTNKIGDGDFDFLLRVDQQLFSDSSRYEQFKQDILDRLKKSSIDEVVITGNGDYRLKGVSIDADTTVDIDISFAIRTDGIDYSSDACLKDRLKTIREQDPDKYKYVVSNVLLAKQVLKEGGVYKPYRSDSSQGGLGGIGIENWVLEHGGSFVDAARSFVDAADGKSWNEFNNTYFVWDFGQNYFAERNSRYLYDNFVYNNMSEAGYNKMVAVLKNYLATIEGQDIRYDSISNNKNNRDFHIGTQFFAQPKVETNSSSNKIDVSHSNIGVDTTIDKFGTDTDNQSSSNSYSNERFIIDEDMSKLNDSTPGQNNSSVEEYVLKDGESLAGRIGTQFFATPKLEANVEVEDNTSPLAESFDSNDKAATSTNNVAFQEITTDVGDRFTVTDDKSNFETDKVNMSKSSLVDPAIAMLGVDTDNQNSSNLYSNEQIVIEGESDSSYDGDMLSSKDSEHDQKKLSDDELINKLKEITSLSELENLSNINANTLFYAIVKSERYELLNDANIRLNINDSATLEKLTDFLLSDEDILYSIHRYGFTFSKDELNVMFNIVFQKHQYSYKFECFLRNFFESKEELNSFIKEHEQFFENYINEEGQNVSYNLKDCDSFVELILKGNHVKLIGGLENYSLSNLKLLVKFLENNKNIPYHLGNDRYAKHLFELKSSLNSNEFIELLNLLKEKSSYDRKSRDSETTFFTNLVNKNIDYLIEVVSQVKSLPKCLTELSAFRDECIKRNRIDLAIKCVLSPDITKNEALVNAYCNELNIAPSDLYERSKWLLSYHEKNNNIFNTFLATSLKDNIFHLNKEHYERFINDVEVQMSISKLNDKELIVLSKVLNIYDYKEYDISSMVVNVINNISNYQELVNSLNLENVSEQDLRKLVSILQLSDNQYQINDIESLQNYDKLKKQFFANNFNLNNLISNKDSLLKALFNIDLAEAQYIDSKYCHDNDDNNILNNLKNSELPFEIYNYLELINKIIECDNSNDLFSLYNNLKDTKVYDSEMPLEPYLRSKYTELYSQSLYRIEERYQVYGPKDSVSNKINFNGKNIQVCVPRANFNFFVHCVGSCSLASDVTDINYRNDWLDRPQLQDHFVACSYINEKGIYSIRSQGSIIFGFDTLESGSILGMGNTDIDSIGRYTKAYDGSRELQEANGNRARYFVPSEILKTINNGYNEIVVERRNTDQSKSEEFKRKPDYIIMMAKSMEQDNFNFLETLYQNQLSFISEEDKKVVKQIGNSRKLKEFLIKYKDIISQSAELQEIPLNNMVNMYVNLIMKAKYYEDCLKAASEFDIPLVIVDKTYYFNKLLTESMTYDDETKERISEFYAQSNESNKSRIFNMVASGVDVTPLMKPKEPDKISFSLFL